MAKRKDPGTSDGYFRHTWTFEGKRYSVRAKDEKDLWRKVAEKQRLLESGMIPHPKTTSLQACFRLW